MALRDSMRVAVTPDVPFSWHVVESTGAFTSPGAGRLAATPRRRDDEDADLIDFDDLERVDSLEETENEPLGSDASQDDALLDASLTDEDDDDPLDDEVAEELDLSASLIDEPPADAFGPASSNDGDDSHRPAGESVMPPELIPLDDSLDFAPPSLDDTDNGDGDDVGRGEADGLADEDASIGIDGSPNGTVDEVDDGGEEGTGEDIAREIASQRLPELDADEDGDVDDESLVGNLLDETVAGATLPWSDTAWVYNRIVEVPLRGVAAGASATLAWGRGLHVVEQPSGTPALVESDAKIGAAALSETAYAYATSSAICAVPIGADVADGPRRYPIEQPVDELTFGGGRLWARTGTTLWELRPSASNLREVEDRTALAIAGTERALYVLSPAEGSSLALERLQLDDGPSLTSSLPTNVLSQLVGEASKAQLDGKKLRIRLEVAEREEPTTLSILLVSNTGRAVQLEDGRTVRTFERVIDATFAGTNPPSVLAVQRRDADIADIIECPVDEVTTRLAEVPAADLAGARMAWDGRRDILLVATGTGLLCFTSEKNH